MPKLPKAERLCSQKQIAALMDKGAVLFHFPFRVFYIFQSPEPVSVCCCQIVVNVPKRNFKKAVTRNLLKRRTREAFRKNKTGFYDQLNQQNVCVHVFFNYISPDILPYDHIETAIRAILSKLSETNTRCTDVSADSGS